MAKVVPFTEARAKLTELLDELQSRQEHVLITRNGRSLPSCCRQTSTNLEETLEILQDKELLDALKRSEADAASSF